MKKLLLVLLIVALASFLFVGCLPVTPSEGEGEGEGEGETEPAVTIAVEDEFDDGLGDVYIRCGTLDVTVTFAEAVAADDDVLVRWDNGPDQGPWELATGSGTSFVAAVDFPCGEADDCFPICIEVMVGDVCCSEVIYHEVRIVDTEDPYVTLYVTAEDCGPCDDLVNISFTSSKLGECDVEEDCCDDDCSGVAGWTVVLWGADANPECDDPCVELSGGCPVDASTGCVDCLVWPDTGEVSYLVEVEMTDNVGHTIGGTGYITLDTDEIVDIDAGPAWYDGTTWTLWDMCEQYED